MKNFSGIFVVIILLFSFQSKKEKIFRIDQSTIQNPVEKIVPLIVDINDTIPNDTILVFYDIHENPIKYSRKIYTGVCIEGECRLVDIILYWNITGSYLGFEMPEGEFLSKTEHDPFTSKEYDRLHELLSDPQSALASYSIGELVPVNESVEQKVDAVSSATIAAVLDYIVEGAVYTTYTLWHIVHGPTKRAIENLTSEILDAGLALNILESGKVSEKIWVLNHISGDMEITPLLQKKLMILIAGKDVYLAERSLHAIKPESLTKEIQMQLVEVFKTTGFLQKRLIIQKLKETKQVDNFTLISLSEEIENLNGTLVKNLLELFASQKTADEKVLTQASNLLKNKNRYISGQAYRFLETADIQNKTILKSMEKYKKKNKLL